MTLVDSDWVSTSGKRKPFHAWRAEKTTIVDSPPLDSGSTSWKNTRHGVAPSIAIASYRSEVMSRITPVRIRAHTGSEKAAVGRMTPIRWSYRPALLMT